MNTKPRNWHFSVTASLVAFLLAIAPPLLAQAPLPKGAPAVAGARIVPVGGTIRLQMRSKKPIKSVFNPRPDVVAVRPLAGDPTTILLTGLQPGVATLELSDSDDRKEAARAAIPPRP